VTRMARTAKERRAGALTEVEVPEPTVSISREGGGWVRAYRTASGCGVFVAQEAAKQAPAGIWLPPGERLLWHVSISHRHRYPGWDEIADVRYELVPDDVTMAMLLPPPDQYLNIHEHVFHLWQIDDRRSLQ
jgi:hypothetical protein